MTWTDILKVLLVVGAVGVVSFLLIEWYERRRKNGRK